MMYMRSSEPHVPLHGCHIFKEYSRLEIFNELVLRPEFQKHETFKHSLQNQMISSSAELFIQTSMGETIIKNFLSSALLGSYLRLIYYSFDTYNFNNL